MCMSYDTLDFFSFFIGDFAQTCIKSNRNIEAK